MTAPKKSHATPPVGERFGDRTVINPETRPNVRGVLEWEVRCDHGHAKWVEATKLVAGRMRGCGVCIDEKRAAARATRAPGPVSSSRRAHTNPRPSKALYAVRAAAEWVTRQPAPPRTIDAGIHFGTELAIMRARLERAVSLGLLRYVPGSSTEPERWGAPVATTTVAA